MLKIYVYGYVNQIQSSRGLERETARNVEMMWLTGRLTPDFKTIADFRKDNGAAIRSACRQFVGPCRGLNLFTHAMVAIDGSRFKACNSRDRSFSRGSIERRMEQVEASIERYLSPLETRTDRHARAAALIGYVLALRVCPRSRRNDMRLKILPAPDLVGFSPPGEDELAARRHSGRGQFRDMQPEARVDCCDVGLGLPLVARAADDRLVGQIEPQRLPRKDAGRLAILAPRAAAGGPLLPEVAVRGVGRHVEHLAVCERA